MNINKFASLISYICKVTESNYALSEDEVARIGSFIQAMIDEAKEPNVPQKINLVMLFDHMINGRRIDAIKEHRSLTGFGLKESKDEIERLMQSLAKSDQE